MSKECIVCGNKIESTRPDAKYDTPACKKKYQRNAEKYSGVRSELKTVKKSSDVFTFTTRDGKPGIRTAKYWFDVPLGAVPVVGKGEPAMPKGWNGREYFLWRDNAFQVGEHGPVITNPHKIKQGSKA